MTRRTINRLLNPWRNLPWHARLFLIAMAVGTVAGMMLIWSVKL